MTNFNEEVFNELGVNNTEESVEERPKRKRGRPKKSTNNKKEIITPKKKERVKKEEPVKPTPDEAKELTPKEYFEYVKSKKNTITDKELVKIYDNALELLNKYVITGQTRSCKKILFLMDCIRMERPIVKAGYNKFVYRWDVEEYIENITDESVGIIELKEFERDLPDEIIDKVLEAKKVFGDNLYVVFTDYTKKIAKKVSKERREKDPILFGALVKDKVVLDRLYYICDWVDENCDLTLDKFIQTYQKKEPEKEVVKTITTDNDIISLKKQLGLINEHEYEKAVETIDSNIYQYSSN